MGAPAKRGFYALRRAELEPRLIELARAGTPLREIAAEIGVAYDTARTWWRKLVDTGAVSSRHRGARGNAELYLNPESDRKYVTKSRACLSCGTTFVSKWPGERVCKPCKMTPAWRMGA